jgi:hypothetical protein
VIDEQLKREDVHLAHRLRGTQWCQQAQLVVRQIDGLYMRLWKAEADLAKMKRDTPKFQGMTELA